MKSKIRTQAILNILLLFIMMSCTAQTQDDKAVDVIREFYQNYIRAFVEPPPKDSLKKSIVINAYCTKNLQEQLKYADEQEFDYDLLINGQFCDVEWLKKMNVKIDSSISNVYNVMFLYINDGVWKKTNVKLKLIKTKNGYKIDKVILSPNSKDL